MSVSAAIPPSIPSSADPSANPLTGFPRLVDEQVLRDALAALDAVINCEPFADVSPPGTEGFLVYDVVAAARERVAQSLGVMA
jgi:hypothetical protein